VTRLSLKTLDRARARRPAYDPGGLRPGIVHLGVGAFHRAHQAVFTEDAIEAAGGHWGIIGVSLRRPDAAGALNPQDGLFTLEIRRAAQEYRIIGSLRRVIVAATAPALVLNALADPQVRVVTLTVTEPAYAFGADGALDISDPGVSHDLSGHDDPRSVAGWLLAGLARRRAAGAGGVSVLSCDNLRRNGERLGAAVARLAAHRDPDLAAWIAGEVAFPNTMVDSITPASDGALRARVSAATGLDDEGAAQREPFASWVIQDRFAGPRPAWERAGALFVADVAGHEALKLHVLNAAHTALACFGPARGHALVREAIADPDLDAFLGAMIAEEVAPNLPGEDVAGYWRSTRARLSGPAIDHPLDQIARDVATKLRERYHPLIIANARAGRPTARLAKVVRAWLAGTGGDPAEALDDPALFDAPFRREAAVRAAILDAGG
jgi:fructuronate reductase